MDLTAAQVARRLAEHVGAARKSETRIRRARKALHTNPDTESPVEKEVGALAREELLERLEARFEKHPHRHRGIAWADVRARLEARADAVRSLAAMERSGGEPDVVGRDETTGEILFFDCVPESPAGRRSACYDGEARTGRKKHPPADSAVEMAATMGIRLLDEGEYRRLQALGPVDTKTSSWLLTPDDIRSRGGALFGDYRYGTVFVYHNGADSYYAARGFRGVARV